jgi:hypothetical protein
MSRAQDMYRKFGFEEVGRRERYYKDNNEDAVLMTLARLPVVTVSSFQLTKRQSQDNGQSEK